MDSDADIDDTENRFCTLPVTGENPTFQAIFLCNDCFLPEENNSNNTPLCVCQSCAEVCHDGNDCVDVEYVAMGPSYCDCHRLGNCKLYEKSLQEAERLGITPERHAQRKQQEDSSSSNSYIQEVFDIPILQDGDNKNLANLLVQQARELIRHTKETHWIDKTLVGTSRDDYDVDILSRPKKLCLLETLAWSIYQSHQERYRVGDDDCSSGDDQHDLKGGAEWWVQVKNIPVVNVATTTTDNSDDGNNNIVTSDTAIPPPTSSSSIDLHYDKDEALAENFGIGSFPTLSTVTYLTAPSVTTTTQKMATSAAAPTIVFDHTYTQSEDEVMSSMLVSRPRVGKHLVFDGRLLHGAPSHPSLLSSSSTPPPSKENVNNNDSTTIDYNNEKIVSQNEEDRNSCRQTLEEETEETPTAAFRVTFLVNIWQFRRPANVKVLDNELRGCLLKLSELTTLNEDANDTIQNCPLEMIPLTIPKVFIEEEDDLPETLRHRIELPFVSNQGLPGSDDNAEDDDKEEGGGGGGAVVMTFPPPTTTGTTDEDTVLVSFGPGMQAYIDYNYEQEEDTGSDAKDGENHPSPSVHSDYV
ncbi:MAG: hypothetical protein ACI90V_007596 [Bacillariaceae sp.]|jgi:hypothetical protein